MNCLVTGSEGFVGVETVKLLKEQGHKVIVLDNFITSLPQKYPSTLSGNLLLKLSRAEHDLQPRFLLPE